jgi:rRNA-processing protein FCF1
MARREQDPLRDVERVLVDGSNLLYALSRTRDGTSPPQQAAIGRLRAALPASVRIELVFDGPDDTGLRNTRIASGLTVRHAGRRSADALLLDLARPSGDLVVTDDRELRQALAIRGTRTAGLAWLIGRLDRPRLAAPSIGNRRPPRPPRIDPRDED